MEQKKESRESRKEYRKAKVRYVELLGFFFFWYDAREIHMNIRKDINFDGMEKYSITLT